MYVASSVNLAISFQRPIFLLHREVSPPPLAMGGYTLASDLHTFSTTQQSESWSLMSSSILRFYRFLVEFYKSPKGLEIHIFIDVVIVDDDFTILGCKFICYNCQIYIMSCIYKEYNIPACDIFPQSYSDIMTLRRI